MTCKRVHPTIRIFVSSAFSDLVHERNALHERVWPQLERYCAPRGFQFQAIDLRWGVPTEAGLDHRTMRICFDELHRSQQLSPQPNFLMLLGDRYGWQPLPEELTPDEFDALLQGAAGNARLERIVRDWYRIDLNARPPVNLLRSRREPPDGCDYTRDATGRDTPAWIEIQEALWSVINRAYPPSLLATRFAQPVDPGRGMPGIVHFQGSATEQEIWHGALSAADAASHVVAYVREIADLDAAAGVAGLGEFVNLGHDGRVDTTLHAAVRALKSHLARTLGDNYLEVARPATLRPVTSSSGRPSLDVSVDHLDEFCDRLQGRLLAIVARQIEDFYRVAPRGDAPLAEVMRDLQDEEERHARFAAARADTFIGRETQTAQLLDYIDTGAARPFVVSGIGGSGKSALMASVARQVSARSGVIVVLRFLGTTRRSSDLRALLTDLCHALRRPFPSSEEVPVDLRLLERELHTQLAHATAGRPVCIFLDGLDQLDPADDAHSLWWIRSTPLPPHARLIVSCLSDRDPHSTPPAWKALQERGWVGVAGDAEVGALEAADAQRLWGCWLRRAGRVLGDAQQASVDARIEQGSATCRQPLYLHILFEEARRWPSYAAPPVLGTSVDALLDAHFERLAEPSAHGALVEPALAYLACARYGLAETELLEILWRDPQCKQPVLASARHALPRPAHRIPFALWARLRHDLEPYLTERGAPGGMVLNFFHRNVSRFVQARFAGTPARRYARHRQLALYFARQHWWVEPRSAQRLRTRPPYSPRPANLRKITELPEQLLALAREAVASGGDGASEEAWKWIERLFRQLPLLEATHEAGRVFELAANFARGLDALPPARPQRRLVVLLDEALRRDIDFIARHARDYPQALFQCLWNSGWWYDCDQAAGFYKDNTAPGRVAEARDASSTGEGGPVGCRHALRLSALLEHWRVQKERATPALTWLRARCPPHPHLGAAQRAVLVGHTSGVNSVAYSPDGTRIASGSGSRSGRDWSVRVWDARSGAQLAVLEGHKDWVMSVCFSPDGRRIASGSADRTIRLWDANSGNELAVLQTGDMVLSLAYRPDGRWIASGAWHNGVRLWDAETTTELLLLTGSGEGQARSVAFSPDGQRIASGGSDGTVRIWDAHHGTELLSLHGHTDTVNSVCYSHDGRRIASGSNDHSARVWETERGKELAVAREKSMGAVYSVAFSPDGRRFATGTEDDKVRIWDSAAGAEIHCRRMSQGEVLRIGLGMTSVAYSPDGRQIASGSTMNFGVRVWDANGDGVLSPLKALFGPIDARGASPGRAGDLIATGYRRGSVEVWDTESGTKLAVLQGHACEVGSIAFSPDGTRIVTGGGGWDRRPDFTIRVWDTVRGTELAVLRGHERRVASVAYTPDGQRIASGSDDSTVRIWDPQGVHALAVMHGHEKAVTGIACSPDGRRIASASEDCTVRVWNAADGAALAVLRGHTSKLERVAFSPDGRCVASCAWDGTVRVWDLATGSALAALCAADRHVESFAYCTGGQRIVAQIGGPRECIQVWDVLSGECLERIPGRGDVRAIAAGAERFPWRAILRGATVVEDARTSGPIAWYEGAFGRSIHTCSSGRRWIGSFRDIVLQT